MAIKNYVLTQDYNAPFVVATGHPKNPQQIRTKLFKKGDVVKGELKHANNQPAFILVNGVLVIPVNIIKEVTTKAVIEDDKITTSEETPKVEEKKEETVIKPITKSLKSSNPRVKYMDAILLGGLVGMIGVYVANKQGWIAETDRKHYIYGGLAGAALGMYVIYRFQPTKTTKVTVTKAKETEEE